MKAGYVILYNADDENRTHTDLIQWILSPQRLPLRHIRKKLVEQDLNLRRLTPTDLQSAPFVRTWISTIIVF